jgi:hypothetical protein
VPCAVVRSLCRVDDTLIARWRAGAPPFDGLTVVSPEARVDELQPALGAVVGVLEASWGASGLRTMLDWHEHDGYVTSPEPATWDQLREATASVAALVDWSSDDTAVRRLWYGDGLDVVLRWCVSSDPDDFGLPPGPPAGQFDVTAVRATAEAIAALVPGATTVRAKKFFDQGWGG